MAHARHERTPAQRALFKTLVAGREIVLTLAQVALFFSIFLAILQFSLPRGTGLQSVYGDGLSSKKRAATVALNGDTLYDLGPVATLTDVKRRVKDRPADGIAWQSSDLGMEFQDRHAIQTLSRSSATLTFANDNRLWLDENSLVVIKRPTKGPARSRRASLAVLGGRVRGSVLPGVRGAGSVTLETPGGAADIQSSDGAAAEFSVTVNPDHTSTVAVLSGLARIQRDGRSLELGPQYALTIDAAGELSDPVRLPDAPPAVTPDDGFTHVTGPSTPPLEFRWEASARADAYRLEIARDPDFADVVFDSETRALSVRPANVSPGAYFWRVSALSGMARSGAGAPRALEVVGDAEPPVLKVQIPEGTVAGASVVVRGTSEPGSRILVSNQPVELSADGSFQCEAALQPGPNLIVVEAVDPAGNVTYHSQYVYAK